MIDLNHSGNPAVLRRADMKTRFSKHIGDRASGSSNTFLRLQRNLYLLFLLYWMTPLITPGTAWLARAGVESPIKQSVRITWEDKA